VPKITEIGYGFLKISAKREPLGPMSPYTTFYMQTVVISIVTCDICIIDLHASAESCVKVSSVGENISHDAS